MSNSSILALSQQQMGALFSFLVAGEEIRPGAWVRDIGGQYLEAREARGIRPAEIEEDTVIAFGLNSAQIIANDGAWMIEFFYKFLPARIQGAIMVCDRWALVGGEHVAGDISAFMYDMSLILLFDSIWNKAERNDPIIISVQGGPMSVLTKMVRPNFYQAMRDLQAADDAEERLAQIQMEKSSAPARSFG